MAKKVCLEEVKTRDEKTLKNFVKERKERRVERFVRFVKKIEMEQNLGEKETSS